MTVTACALAVLFAFEAGTTTAGECALTDNRCKAKQYERRAAAAAMPGARALYLYNAHRSYLILFEKAGQVRDLCEARRTLEASLAVEGQPQGQRSLSQRKQEDIAVLAGRNGASCKPGKKRSPPQAGGKASAPQAEAVAELLKAPSERLEALATQAAPIPDPVPPTTSQARVLDEPTGPIAVEGPVSRPSMRLVIPPRSRARVGVGAGLVTVGVGLLAGMTGALVARHGYDAKIAALSARGAQEGRALTAAEMADSVAWDARFVRLERTGAVLGGLAVVSIVAAVMVLVVPQRSRAQARVRPVGAGVHINF